MDKKELAIKLSKLKTFVNPNVNLEQYQTNNETAAEVLWWAFLTGDIENKLIADLGCGNGVFGIGALLLGAKQVYFVDTDNTALLITKENFDSLGLRNGIFVRKDITEFDKLVDVVFENPPFGIQNRGADKVFLDKAMRISKVIYSFHMLETKEFIETFVKDNSFKIDSIKEFDFELKRTQQFHTKEKYIIRVGCWRILKN